MVVNGFSLVFRLSFPTLGQNKRKREANVSDGLAWVPGQVEVGGGCPLLLTLARDLDLLPDLHRDTLLAVTKLLVTVLSEITRNVIASVTLDVFLLTCWMFPDGHFLPPTPSPALSSSCPGIEVNIKTSFTIIIPQSPSGSLSVRTDASLGRPRLPAY